MFLYRVYAVAFHPPRDSIVTINSTEDDVTSASSNSPAYKYYIFTKKKVEKN